MMKEGETRPLLGRNRAAMCWKVAGPYSGIADVLKDLPQTYRSIYEGVNTSTYKAPYPDVNKWKQKSADVFDFHASHCYISGLWSKPPRRLHSPMFTLRSSRCLHLPQGPPSWCPSISMGTCVNATRNQMQLLVTRGASTVQMQAVN
jgi:hypothetical protein